MNIRGIDERQLAEEAPGPIQRPTAFKLQLFLEVGDAKALGGEKPEVDRGQLRGRTESERGRLCLRARHRQESADRYDEGRAQSIASAEAQEHPELVSRSLQVEQRLAECCVLHLELYYISRRSPSHRPGRLMQTAAAGSRCRGRVRHTYRPPASERLAGPEGSGRRRSPVPAQRIPRWYRAPRRRQARCRWPECSGSRTIAWWGR